MRPAMMRHSETGRFATPMFAEHSFVPRLDAIPQQARLDPQGPLVAAWLGNRPVVLARQDPRRRRRPGEPVDLTVPITMSRFRRALDIESGRATMRYEPSLIDDWPLTHMPIAGLDDPKTKKLALMLVGLGIIAGVGLLLASPKARRRTVR